MVFSKTTHYRGYLGKIRRNPKCHDCHLIFGIYRNWLLSSNLHYVACVKPTGLVQEKLDGGRVKVTQES